MSGAAAQPGLASATLGAQSGAHAASAKRPWLSAPAVLIGAILTACLAALFWDWFLRQARFSSERSADWGHAFLVPFISGYFIYRRREELRRLRPTTFWPGLLPVLVGVSVYFLWSLTRGMPGTHMFPGFALVLTIAGLTILLAGPRMFSVLCIPVAYLGFGVTLADRLMQGITFRLQLIASEGAALVLGILGQAAGFSVDLRGNTLEVVSAGGESHMLNVAEACSGMRMVIAFLALGVAVAFLSCTQWWQRVALIALAVPVAVATNVIRVASMGLASLWAPGLAEGEAHSLIGVLWLVPAFLLFLAIVWALKRLVHDAERKPASLAKRAKEAAIG